jgi:hypothetical protein
MLYEAAKILPKCLSDHFSVQATSSYWQQASALPLSANGNSADSLPLYIRIIDRWI